MKITTSAFKHFSVISSTQTNITLCFVKHLEFSTKAGWEISANELLKLSPALALSYQNCRSFVIQAVETSLSVSAVLTLLQSLLTNSFCSFHFIFSYLLISSCLCLCIVFDLFNNNMTLCCRLIILQNCVSQDGVKEKLLKKNIPLWENYMQSTAKMTTCKIHDVFLSCCSLKMACFASTLLIL